MIHSLRTVKGFPQIMFEGFVSSIDSHNQLYGLCRSGSYNQRSFSSLENETFFGTLTDMDPTRLGCPKAENIPQLMELCTAEVIQNQGKYLLYWVHDRLIITPYFYRIFDVRTSRKPIYPARKMDFITSATACNLQSNIIPQQPLNTKLKIR